MTCESEREREFSEGPGRGHMASMSPYLHGRSMYLYRPDEAICLYIVNYKVLHLLYLYSVQEGHKSFQKPKTNALYNAASSSYVPFFL